MRTMPTSNKPVKPACACAAVMLLFALPTDAQAQTARERPGATRAQPPADIKDVLAERNAEAAKFKAGQQVEVMFVNRWQRATVVSVDPPRVSLKLAETGAPLVVLANRLRPATAGAVPAAPGARVGAGAPATVNADWT